MRRVVTDTGPLLHLSEAESLHLLRLVGNLYIPPHVITEITNLWSAWKLPEWIKVTNLTGQARQSSVLWQQAGVLDAGEAEAIALAQQLKADWFLTDDTIARLFASESGLEVHGSLGIILWAAVVGHLDDVAARQSLNRLAASSLWMSRRILREAQAALDEIFSEV